MARKRYGLNEYRIARFRKEGRGFGEGKYYKPFWKTSDVPSRGRLHRFYCDLSEREHHLLSDNEYYTFLSLRWRDDVIDIREQFPFWDRSESLEVAARLGVEHPVDRHSGALWVITTDLLVTLRTDNCSELIAIAVKESKDLADSRTLEKLEIERRLCERREIPWYLVTELQVKNTFTQNLAWMLNYEDLKKNKPIYSDVDLLRINDNLAAEQVVHPQIPICRLCEIVDQKLGYEVSTTLGALRRLMAQKIIRVDLTKRCLQELPAKDFIIQEVTNGM